MNVLCSIKKEDIKFIKLRAMGAGVEIEDEQKKSKQKVGWGERKPERRGVGADREIEGYSKRKRRREKDIKRQNLRDT